MTVGSRPRRPHGTIGDGPHGSHGDGSGDFDFYKLAAARAGQNFVVDINTVFPATLDSVVVVWDAAGNILALNDDDGLSLRQQVELHYPAERRLLRLDARASRTQFRTTR